MRPTTKILVGGAAFFAAITVLLIAASLMIPSGDAGAAAGFAGVATFIMFYFAAVSANYE